ncbi:rho GTPase-activating protein 23-like isoform X2 [Drosophila navojoa]|uniref:rho GTPase-activating protein 23-like isoform X2 n=1 Tax=Drosophila navojoa TaxID=7232 RepID=UPI0011BD630C|nr:rho GTPase-activating protein 23-like isoform X2 [Drosophila navojoa]
MLQNSNATAAAAAAATATPSTAAAAAAAANNAAIAASSIQPKLVVIRRRQNQGFGFTLRHFIAYPPEDDAASWPQEATNAVGGGGNVGGSSGGVVGLEPTSPTSLPPYQVKAMETIFIKEVHANGPAHHANLQTGDRVLMVNNTPIAGIAYSTIVSMIKQTPSVLTLHVVPKECDVLQMHYTSIAHTPESNRLTMSAQAPQQPSMGAGHTTHSPVLLANAGAAGIKSTFPQQQLISYPAVAANTSSTASSVSPATPLHGGSRSGSITSNASGSGLPTNNSSHHHQHQHQHQHQQQQQLYHHQQQHHHHHQQQLLSSSFMR